MTTKWTAEHEVELNRLLAARNWYAIVQYRDCRCLYGPFASETDASNWQLPKTKAGRGPGVKTIVQPIAPDGELPEYLRP